LNPTIKPAFDSPAFFHERATKCVDRAGFVAHPAITHRATLASHRRVDGRRPTVLGVYQILMDVHRGLIGVNQRLIVADQVATGVDRWWMGIHHQRIVDCAWAIDANQPSIDAVLSASGATRSAIDAHRAPV
jgi:hypothetical protein